MSAVRPQFVHEALVYDSTEAFLARLVPFIRDGLEARQPVIAVLGPDKIALLEEVLGDQARDVLFGDASALYRRPAHAIAEYRDHLDAHLAARPELDLIRIIGEVRFGSSLQEHADWTMYESMLNEGFADYPAWVICPYDTRALPTHIVANAPCTHPLVSTSEQPEASSGYIDTDELIARPVPREAGLTDREPFGSMTIHDEAELDELRRFVAGAARAAGLAPTVVLDVSVAAGELVRDALRRGSASVHVVRHGARWMCDVVGGSGETVSRTRVGLSIARLVSDRVELSTETGAQTVRLNFSGPAKGRQRILDAAAELFYQRGIRATGTNAIIAHAGVSKATFFRHFPSKDDLVVAWLEQPGRRWFDRIRTELESTTEPERRLLGLFDLLGAWCAEEDFRGCPFQNAAAEMAQADHPVRNVVDEYALEIQRYLGETAAAADLRDPASVAEQLTVLVWGAIAAAVATRSPDAARIARDSATELLARAAEPQRESSS
jgi:AcrR family transcriptional regulator